MTIVVRSLPPHADYLDFAHAGLPGARVSGLGTTHKNECMNVEESMGEQFSGVRIYIDWERAGEVPFTFVLDSDGRDISKQIDVSRFAQGE